MRRTKSTWLKVVSRTWLALASMWFESMASLTNPFSHYEF
jgi:hypothetical protein